MNDVKVLRWVLVLLVCALALAACGGDDGTEETADGGEAAGVETAADDAQTAEPDEGTTPTESATPGDVGEGELVTVRGASLSGGMLSVNMAIDVADEQGFFADEGIDFEFVETSGGGAIVQAVLAGGADIGFQNGTTAVLGAYAEGADLRIIGSAVKGYDGLYVGPPQDDVEDICGETLGYSSPGAGSHIAAEVVAQQREDECDEPVETAAIGGTSDQITAARTGQILAAYTNPDVALSLVDDEGWEIYVNAFEELPEYDDVSTRVYLTTGEYLEENREVVTGVLRAFDTAWEWIYDNPEEAVDIWLERGNLEWSQESSVRALTEYYSRDRWEITPIEGIEQSIQDGLEYDLISRELTEEEIDEVVQDLLGEG